MYNNLKLKDEVVLLIIKKRASIEGISEISFTEIQDRYKEIATIGRRALSETISKLEKENKIEIIAKGKGKTKTTYKIL